MTGIWLIAVASAVFMIGLVHGRALRYPAGKIDMMLHRAWHTECRHRG